ncbi:MAG: hypothetical protein JRN15_20705 [Nitrososphaerota archaeon]|nr:hypothetical protein [Nitrososphaerota archaeon]
MKVLTGFALYLLGAFILIALGLTNVLPIDYLGGMVIGLYIVALIYAFVNAIRSGEKLIKQEVAETRRKVDEKQRVEESRAPLKDLQKEKEEITVSA